MQVVSRAIRQNAYEQDLKQVPGLPTPGKRTPHARTAGPTGGLYALLRALCPCGGGIDKLLAGKRFASVLVPKYHELRNQGTRLSRLFFQGFVILEKRCDKGHAFNTI